MPYDQYEEDERRDSHYLSDDEYRRMRKAEDDSYEYHGGADESEKGKKALPEDDDYPYPTEEATEPEQKPTIVYEQRGSGGVIRIPASSNLRWLPLFYALPEELVSKRPAYREIPRNVKLLIKEQKYVDIMQDDSFVQMVMDCYSWAIWQYMQVPDGKGGYRDIPGSIHHYSADFPMWRMSYLIASHFHAIFQREMQLDLPHLFRMPEDDTFPWLTYQQFSNLVGNATDMVITEQNLQPSIDAVWEQRQPEDYEPHSFKQYEFLRQWNHSRNHPHLSVEQLAEDGFELNDPQAEFDRKVIAEQQIAQFEATLSETDKRILQYRMKNYKLQDIADIVGYQTASAVAKRIDRIAEQYERFINPPPDDESLARP